MPKATSASSSSSSWQQILNSINHILIFLVAIFFFVLARSLEFKDTAMHMFMTGIGFHVLVAEALMSHYKVNPLTRWLSHRNKSRYHGVMQLLGSSMVLLGALGKISQKEVHFTSWHGKIGLVATLGCSASLLGGLLNFFQPKFILKVFPPSELRFRHNLFGMITFTFGMGAVYLGYYTKFFTRYVDHEFIPAMMVVSVLVYILTLIAPLGSFLTKLKYRQQNKKQQSAVN